MSITPDPIRDQQRDTWDRFSAGWKKWDAQVLGWLAPFGEAMLRHAALRDAYAAAGLHDIAEEEVSSELAHDTPQRYWEFMTDIAAPPCARRRGAAALDGDGGRRHPMTATPTAPCRIAA